MGAMAASTLAVLLFLFQFAAGCKYFHTVTPGRPITLGAFFSFQKFDFATRSFQKYSHGEQMFAAFKMAIDDINNGVIRNPANPMQKLLPNHQLSYVTVDYKRNEGIASAATARIMDDESLDPLTLIGLDNAKSTIMVQYVARACLLPQITYSSPAATLLPPHPSLFRTNPADYHMAYSQLAFLKANGWTRCIMVTSNDMGGSAWSSMMIGVARQFYPELRFIQVVKYDIADGPDAVASRERAAEQIRSAHVNIYISHSDQMSDLALFANFMYDEGFLGSSTGNVWLFTTIEPVDVVNYGLMNVPEFAADQERLIEAATGMFVWKPAFRGNVNPFMPPKDNGFPVDMYYDWWLPRWRRNRPTWNGTSCLPDVDVTGQPVWRRRLNDRDPTSSYCANVTYQEEVFPNVPYSYDAALAAAYALHEVLHVRNMTAFSNQDLMDAYLNIQFYGASGLVMMRNDTQDKGRLVGVQMELTNFRGDLDKGFEFVGTWVPAPMNMTTRRPVWDPMNGFTMCNPRIYPAECVSPRWATQNNTKPDDLVYCPPGTLQVEDECVQCDKQGMDTYQDEIAQRLCKPCPKNTERRVGSSGASIDQCLCFPGYYQAEGLAGGAECSPCVEGAECLGFHSDTLVNANPYPKEDYWADPLHPADIKSCLKDYCDGGPNFTCAKHHHAPMAENRMCEQVAKGSATMSGFFMTCPDGYLGTESWIFSIGLVLMALIMFFLVNGVLREYVSIDVFFKNVRLLAIGSSFRLRWHDNLTPLFAFFRLILFDVDIVQPNCIMQWTFYERFLTQLILPFGMSMLYFMPLGFQLGMNVVTRGQAHSRDVVHATFNKSISSSLAIFLTCYPSFASVILAALRCERYTDGNVYLSVDPNIECFSSKHNLLFVLALLCLPVLIGIPFGIAFFLMRGLRLKQLHLEDSLERFGSVYTRYKTNLLFWESLFLFKVLTLVFIQVFLPDVPLTQVFLSASIHLGSIASQFFARPYLNNHVNMLESVMLSIVCLFTICGTMFNDADLAEYYKTSFSIIVLVVLGVGALIAPVVACIDVLHEYKSARAASFLHRRLLHLLRTTEIDPHMHCFSLRMKNALEEVKAEGGPKATKTFMQRVKDSKFGLETLRSMLTSQQSSKSAVEQLKVEEIHKTIRGRSFWQWAVTHNHTVESFDKLLALDELIAPFVSDRSETSVYSRNNTAEFWRGIIHAFPDLPNFIRMCNNKEVGEMRNTFLKLQRLGANAIDRSDSSIVHYVDYITAVDISSVVYWLCHTEPKQREMFYELLNKVVRASGRGESESEDSVPVEEKLNSLKSTKQVEQSELRLLEQWAKVNNSTSNDIQIVEGSQSNKGKGKANKVAPLPEDAEESPSKATTEAS